MQLEPQVINANGELVN